MKHLKRTASVFALAASVGFAGSALAQDIAGPEPYPIPVSMQEGDAALVDYDALIGLGGPTNFNEPEWVSELVAAGKIPPVEERIPAEPIVMKTESMPDGAGVYGGVFRHVSGGRPEGWNWMAGQHQGWGGLSKTSQMCLVRTGPMWILSPDKVEPLPRLATSWEWSEDGHQLTMDLIEGARWSDGDPFDADDIVFMWEDNIKDTGVPSRMQAEALGEGVELEVLGPYQIRWTFPDSEFSVPNLLKMSYISMCPGPSHILKPLHPAYNADATYDSYLNALPADALPWVTMGPWVATEYKPDEIMVFRRNPYFPVVDSDGNQLPYIDEMHFKLSTWEDRTIQTVAGSADFTNMENPSIYIESLKAAKEDGFPNFVYWGPRSLHWRLDMNLSTVCGVTSERDQAIRDLNRNLDFRRAVTHAVDREAAGQALVRGPFTHPFAGGLHTETEFFKPEMVVYYPYDVSSSKALLSGLGFEDSDGDGFVNWPDGGPLAGENLEVVMGYSSQRTTDTALADSLITMMQEVGIKAIGKSTPELVGPWRDTCEWDWLVDRGDREFHVPLRNLDNLSAITNRTPVWHQGTGETQQELMPFEEELVEIMRNVRGEPDSAARGELLREYNRIFTENVYHVGVITVPAALMINNRVKNVAEGTPVLAYQWSEDNALRERFWVPVDDQLTQLLPGKLPGIE